MCEYRISRNPSAMPRDTGSRAVVLHCPSVRLEG
jgi:hypothetical protein